jgi:hypothetical protein
VVPDVVNGVSGTATAIAGGYNHTLAIVGDDPALDRATGHLGDGGGTVSTGAAATSEDPVETSVTVPAGTGGGAVVIAETAPTATPPIWFRFVGQQVNITAPSASVENPLVLTFLLHSSIAGTDPDAVVIFKAGVLVGACAGAGAGAGATPDPCVESRALIGDNIQIVVRTSTASAWNFGWSTADCVCEVEKINPNQVVLQNVGTGEKGSEVIRKMVITIHAVDTPRATCDPGEFSNPTPVNLEMKDDSGNIIVDNAKFVRCEQGVTTNLKRDVFFWGPDNCENGAVPPPKPDFSLGTITSTGSAPGTADYVESTRIKCFE